MHTGLLLIPASQCITAQGSQSGQLESGALARVCLCTSVHLTHSGASYKSASPFPGPLRTRREWLGFFKAGEKRGKGGRG